MAETISGINVDRVTRWLADRAEVHGDLHFDLVAHGRSNLTFIVNDQAGQKWVLRRPPTGHVLASAHDMGREHRIIAALADTDVPVPALIGMCDDLAVNDAPFYVMEFMEGHILKAAEDVERFTEQERRLMSESLVDKLAALHQVDPDHVGLGELGRKEDYLARQLRRWKRQVTEGSDREMKLFHELHAQLEAKAPPQQGAGIVHGDYRLDNCMMGQDSMVAAVLDWELCTLGDVLSDVGGLLMWWGDPSGDSRAMTTVPTLAPGFLTPTEVVERYAKSSERDLSALPFYTAFQHWRLGGITEGVRIRFVSGSMGDKDIGDELVGFEERIEALLIESQRLLSLM